MAHLGNTIVNGALRVLGDTSASGQIKTSFKNSIANGSFAASSTTVPDLCTELRYSSGATGSVSIGTAYTKDSVTIPTGWYNFMWIPHRSGGVNGSASGDNCDYGTLYLTAMNMTSSFFLVRFTSGSIAEVKNVLKDDNTDTKVTQTATTANAAYEVLFSETADNTTRTEGARKTTTLRFNPASAALMQGTATVASGFNSHAEGYQTTASGNQSHAEGHQTIASGDYSHAEGIATQAIGDSSHAEGYCTTASGDAAHAEGHKTTASGTGAHAEGGYTTATTGGGTKATGENSHAEGYGTTASGQSSHAEGYNTLVVKELYSSMYGSHAEGYQTTCGRDGSGKHAEGFKTSAYGTGAHSEGVSTIANGNQGAHAEGESTTASGLNSHAEGYQTIAKGKGSHAAGQYTCAAGVAQTVVGKYNVADTSSAFIIGNGTANDARSNAFKVDFSGNFDTGNFKSEHSGYYGYTNLNSLPCNGFYWGRENVPSVAAGSLAPDNTCGAITWKYSALFEDQIAMDSYNSGALFTRSKTNGAWSTWKKVKMSDDQYVCSGVEYDPSRERVTKVTASDGWNSQIYSKRGYKNNVYVRFKAGQTNKAIMVGLNSDPTTDANYASIDFCWYLQNNGTLAIYESGTAVNTITSGTNPTYISGEEFYIEVHDNKVYYYRNNDYSSEPILERVSTNKTTSSSSNFNKLYFDSSFHGQSGFIYDVEFGVTTQTASRILVNNEAGQGLLNHFPIAVSRNIVSSTTGMQHTTLQTFPYFSYCPPYHSLSVGEGASASKFEAFALGYNVEANANSSFATGEGTVANGVCQTVIGKYNVADTSSAFIIGNGSSDSARTNALKIGLDGRFYPTNTFPESYLGWNEVSAGDGRDLTADVSPIDACLNDALRGNRFFGIPDSNVSITYSRNAGSTWTDYGGEAYQKTALFAEGSNFAIGKADSTNKATANGNKYQLRVWIDTLNVCYTVLRKIMVNVSTQGSNDCRMDFEVSTDNSSWTKIRTMAIAGWSGWNVMNVGWIQTHNAYRYLRFTFRANGGDTNYNGLSIFQIYGYGGFGWIASSQMAASATPYITYGSKATQFFGTLAVSSNNYNDYNEGIRINATGNGAAVLTMGGSWGSLSGMSDYAWCFVTWNSTRRLVIGHGTSGSSSSTYFYKNDAGATPSLHIGENLQVDGTITGRMADYAEYFEWADGNPQSEERIAKFVTFDDGNKIRFATSNDDYILGVVSAHPFIIGNADGDDRDNEYLKDEYGRVIIEPAPKMKSSTDGKYIPVYDENGEPVYEGTRPKPNPNYDSSKNIPRDKKPEWAPIGMLGILTVIDDGTCTVNSYATVAEGGIAIKAEANSLFKYRVIKRRTNNIIDIIFR